MIRLATIADLKEIELFDPFCGNREEDIAENRVFAWQQKDTVCGYISMARAGFLGRPYVEYLAINSECLRRGIALSLLSHVEGKYSGKRLFISTESDNTPMLALLTKTEYTAAGEVSGANLSGVKELYYYKEISA
jgi:ribosomal protein S18 acetylase RimI-like enzyme